MRRFSFLLLIAVAFVGCNSKTPPTPTATPTPTSEITEADLASTILTTTDVGTDWKPFPNAKPDTFQVGGRVGTATYIAHATAEQTVAFSQTAGPGYVSNTVFVLPTVDDAKQVMTKQSDADKITTWRQERDDGGHNDAKKLGPLTSLETLGDEMYAGRFEVDVFPKGSTTPTKRTVEYVAYRIGRVMSFVVAQDAGVATFAKRQEARLARLTQ